MSPVLNHYTYTFNIGIRFPVVYEITGGGFEGGNPLQRM